MSLSLIEQARRAGVPAVGVVGDDWPVYGPQVDAWTRTWSRRSRVARLAERVTGLPAHFDPARGGSWMFISEFVRRQAAAVGWDVADAPIARPGVDTRRFVERPPEPWQARLLYAGRLDPRKGVASAIEALTQLPREASLTIDGAGDPRHAEELRARAEAAGVRDRVTFQCSPRRSLATVYAKADAVVFPVRWAEPWGLVPLEAMAVGRPVVATATGGAAEYLRDEENCVLFAPGDVGGLARAVARLGEDAELRSRLVAGGRTTVAGLTEGSFHTAVLKHIERTAAMESRR